jgi:hypothetical protein
MTYYGRTLLAVTLLAFFAGCGDENSPEARRAAAQRALDKGECATAVSLFDTLQKEEPSRVDLRLDLSAAYLCQAGFSVQGLLKVVTDFSKDKEGTKNTLFKNITDQVSTLIPDTALWRANVCNSKALLGDVNQTTWPCASKGKSLNTVTYFKNDPDAGYILSIVNLADATLTVADAFSIASNITNCAGSTTATSTTHSACLTTNDILSIVSSLIAAQQSVAAATGTGGELAQTTDNLLFNANGGKEVTANDPLEDEEVLNYLLTQKIIKNTDTVGLPPGCIFNRGTGKYECTPTTP